MSHYTENDARKFELFHEILSEYPGEITKAAKRLAELAQALPFMADTVWSTQTIRTVMESREYAAWQHDYLFVMGNHATFSAFKAMSDPAKIPKAVAADVLKDAREGKLKDAARKAASASDAPRSGIQTSSLVEQMGLGDALSVAPRRVP